MSNKPQSNTIHILHGTMRDVATVLIITVTATNACVEIIKNHKCTDQFGCSIEKARSIYRHARTKGLKAA